MGFLANILTWVFKLIGFIQFAENLLSGYRAEQSAKKAMAVAKSAAPVSVKGVEDKLDAGEA